VLWSKVDIDREAAQDLRRRVLNDIRLHETQSTQLSQQESQDGGELVKAQAGLAKARAELERLDTILARPRDD
jgi:multidrug resistance efflux pump